MCRVLFLDVKIWWGAANVSRVAKKGWEVGEGFSRVRNTRIPTAISFFCCHKCHTKGRNRVKKGGQKQQNEEKNYVFFVGKNVYFEGQNWWIVKKYPNVSGKILLFSRLQICLWHLWQQKCKTPILRICAHAWEWGIIDFFTFRDVWMMCAQFLLLSWVGFCSSVCVKKTTRRFVQSEPSFSQKQPVGLCKVSHCFIMKGRLVVRDSLVVFID